MTVDSPNAGPTPMGKRPDSARMKAVLDRTLPDGAANDAFTLWQSDFSELPGFGVVRFVQELGRRYGLTDSQRRNLRLALFREIYAVIAGHASNNGARDVRPDNLAAQTVRTPRAPSPEALVLRAMLSALAESAGRNHRAEFTGLFREYVSGVGLSDAVGAEVLAWDAGGDEAPLVDADPETLSRLIHAGYNALCETVGPVGADRGLSLAVQRAEMLDAARELPPRSLL